MNATIVKYKLNPAQMPALTQTQKQELVDLAALPDSEIDKSDLPSLSDSYWRTAVRNPLYKPTKQSTTVRVDQDILIWLKSKGQGYQTRINSILRSAMLGDYPLKSESSHEYAKRNI